jgi:hypothetical protein
MLAVTIIHCIKTLRNAKFSECLNAAFWYFLVPFFYYSNLTQFYGARDGGAVG